MGASMVTFRPILIDQPHPSDFRAPYFYCSSNPSAFITYASPSIQDVLGFDPVKLVGKCYLDLLIEDDPLNSDAPHCVEMIAERGSLNAIRALTDAFKRRRVVAVQSTRQELIDGEDKVRNHHVVCDITDEFELQRSIIERWEALHNGYDGLSPLEKEVAQRVTSGKMNREIANLLDVSERTVERGRSSIQRQFGVRSSPEMIAILSEYQLLCDLLDSAGRPPWQQAYNFPPAMLGPNGEFRV